MSTVLESSGQAFVGALACQRDSSLSKDFETLVVSCQPTKKKKFEIELVDTILFPEGGGQPSDTGNFLTEDNKSIPVFSVSRRGLRAIHVTDEPVNVGSRVVVEVDWEKRMDYMQQHTGQHLVSAYLEKLWNLSTLSWAMAGVPSPKKPVVETFDLFNYLEIERKLTEEEVTELTKAVNDAITKQPFSIIVTEKAADSQSDVNTSKIPDDYDLSKGIVRTVSIGELDQNPCCGTHLKSTSQLGSILILNSQSSVRGTNSKLYFMCGERVRKYGAFAQEILSKTKSILSCNEKEIPEKCDLQRQNLQKTLKREQYWMKEVANSTSKILIETLSSDLKAYMLRDEFGSLEFLLQCYQSIDRVVTEKKLTNYSYILVGRERASNSGAVIIVSDSSDRISELSAKLATIVSKLKGGGGKKGGKWQGKVLEYSSAEWASIEAFLEKEY